MTPTRRGSIRLPVLTLAVGLTALTLAALACAPAAPTRQDAPTPGATPAPEPTPTILWLSGTPPSESELATWAARPTRTPYPPGYVKPTDLPTYTPMPSLPTIKAQMEQEEQMLQTAEARSAAAAGYLYPTRPPQELALESITQQLHADDAIARIRVGSSRYVRVPDSMEPNADLVNARRQNAEVITTYQGTLPTQIDLISYPDFIDAPLDSGQEYILGVYKFWILESDYSPSEPWRAPHTQTDLEAAGGEAYAYNVRLAWIIDGQIARKVPYDYAFGIISYDSHLAAARDNSLELPISIIEAALRPGGG